MYLFAIYIGGSHPRSLIEIHDMRFVVANCIEETFAGLYQNWWGTPSSLHIDAWAKVTSIRGYQIQLSKLPSLSTNQLYFVNLGGYDPADSKVKCNRDTKVWTLDNRKMTAIILSSSR